MTSAADSLKLTGLDKQHAMRSLACSGLPASAITVGIVLLDKYNVDARRDPFPSQANLAFMAGLPERTVRSGLTRLVKEGWFKSFRHAGPSAVNVYMPVWKKFLPAAKAWKDNERTWRERRKQRDDAENQPESFPQEQNEAGSQLPPSPAQAGSQLPPSPAIPCQQAGSQLPTDPRTNLEKKPLTNLEKKRIPREGLSGGADNEFNRVFGRYLPQGETEDGEPTVDDGASGEDVAIVDKGKSVGLEDGASTFQASETVFDRRQQNFLLPIAGKSQKQVAENKAMERWNSALQRRLSPNDYGAVLTFLTPELSAKATVSEMARKGSGVRAVLAGLEERQVASWR